MNCAQAKGHFLGGIKMLHRLAVACVVVALFAGFSATRAKADSTNVVTTTVDNFDFTISGNSYTWSVTLPPTVVEPDPAFGAFGLVVPYSLNGGTPTPGGFTFYTSSNLGGFTLGPPGSTLSVLSTTGPSLFTGPVTAPVFDVGTFTGFIDLLSGETGGTMTITQTTESTATPEPGTLLLTGIGVFALFWLARKKKPLSLAA